MLRPVQVDLRRELPEPVQGHCRPPEFFQAVGCRGLEVRPDGIWCEDKSGKQFLVPGTTVIAALGQRSRSDVVDALRDGAPFVRVIGDAARVSTITNAVYWGYHAALDI